MSGEIHTCSSNQKDWLVIKNTGTNKTFKCPGCGKERIIRTAPIEWDWKNKMIKK